MNENQKEQVELDSRKGYVAHRLPEYHPTDYEMRKDAVIQAVNATYLMKGATNNPIEEKDFMKTVETIYKFLRKGKNN